MWNSEMRFEMQSSLFEYARASQSNDYHLVPVSEKQLSYARTIAQRSNTVLPDGVQEDRRRLSEWIDAHKKRAVASRLDRYPSSKQVAFAESIARRKRRQVPRECFRDRGLMSRWIDSNR
jgi:hypothetical protein